VPAIYKTRGSLGAKLCIFFANGAGQSCHPSYSGYDRELQRQSMSGYSGTRLYILEPKKGWGNSRELRQTLLNDEFV